MTGHPDGGSVSGLRFVPILSRVRATVLVVLLSFPLSASSYAQVINCNAVRANAGNYTCQQAKDFVASITKEQRAAYRRCLTWAQYVKVSACLYGPKTQERVEQQASPVYGSY